VKLSAGTGAKSQLHQRTNTVIDDSQVLNLLCRVSLICWWFLQWYNMGHECV